MNKNHIKTFNTISFILCTLSGIVVALGRHAKRFCTYNDTDSFIKAVTIPGSNPEILLGCLPHLILGLGLGLLVSCLIWSLTKIFPNRFSLAKPKFAISLLGFSILLFCLCVNHMGLELQFVLKHF